MNFEAHPPFNEMRQGFATFKKRDPHGPTIFPNFLKVAFFH
jgi:hypothetical protein